MTEEEDVVSFLLVMLFVCAPLITVVALTHPPKDWSLRDRYIRPLVYLVLAGNASYATALYTMVHFDSQLAMVLDAVVEVGAGVVAYLARYDPGVVWAPWHVAAGLVLVAVVCLVRAWWLVKTADVAGAMGGVDE